MSLINCKVYLQLNWIEECILSSAGDTAKFAMADPKLNIPMVTFSTKDSANWQNNLTKDLKDRFIRIVMEQNLQK